MAPRLNHFLFQISFMCPSKSTLFHLLSAIGSWPVWTSFQVGLANGRTCQETRGREQSEVRFYSLLTHCLTRAMFLNKVVTDPLKVTLSTQLSPSWSQELIFLLFLSCLKAVTPLLFLWLGHCTDHYSFLTDCLHFYIHPFMTFPLNYPMLNNQGIQGKGTGGRDSKSHSLTLSTKLLEPEEVGDRRWGRIRAVSLLLYFGTECRQRQRITI